RLLPFDKIGIIATDEQMEVFDRVFNERETVEQSGADSDDVILYKLKVDHRNDLNGRTINESQICEKTNGLILGVERDNHKILNPERDFDFQKDDIVWIVGERKKILNLNK